MRIVYMLLVFCLIVTACSSNKTTSSSNNQAHDHKPTLDVKVEVTRNKAVVFVDTDVSIVKSQVGQARKTGEGHIHMYLDDQEKETVTEGTKEYSNLSAGPHIVRVSLHNNDHTPYDKTVTVEFEIK